MTAESFVIVQTSDVHFGRKQVYDSFGIIDGFRPHNHLLCQALQESIEDEFLHLGVDRSGATMLVTGDLTVAGVDGEFRCAKRFYTASSHFQGSIDPLERWGIAWNDQALLMCAGNHDHWNGLRLGFFPRKLHNPNIYPRHFRPIVWCQPLPVKSVRPLLQLWGLDSSSGFRDYRGDPMGWNRARGIIDADHLDELDDKLAADDRHHAGRQRPMRALVLHHPLLLAPPLHRLPETQVTLLQKICVNHGVQVILAGHVHSSLPPLRLHRDPDLWQVVCGSTLQGLPRANVHGYWIHRIDRDDTGAVRWKGIPLRWSVQGQVFRRGPTHAGLDVSFQQA